MAPAYVNDQQKSVVPVFDTATLTKIAEWKPGTCEEPTGMAVDAGYHRLYSVCDNHFMAVLDSDDGHLVL
jgi:DNA-binding beta-propeller fold protein YncE